MTSLAGTEIRLRGFRGGHFSRFYAARSTVTDGPGWYVYGRSPAYGGRYVMLCARPNVKPRKHPHYNAPVRKGWRTRAEAMAIAEIMNRMDAESGCLAYLDTLGDLHGTEFKES